MSVTGSCTTRIKHKTSLEPFAPPDGGTWVRAGQIPTPFEHRKISCERRPEDKMLACPDANSLSPGETRLPFRRLMGDRANLYVDATSERELFVTSANNCGNLDLLGVSIFPHNGRPIGQYQCWRFDGRSRAYAIFFRQRLAIRCFSIIIVYSCNIVWKPCTARGLVNKVHVCFSEYRPSPRYLLTPISKFSESAAIKVLTVVERNLSHVRYSKVHSQLDPSFAQLNHATDIVKVILLEPKDGLLRNRNLFL